MPTSLVWFRCDLRLADNPALHAAVRRGGAVIPVYIWSSEEETAPGASATASGSTSEPIGGAPPNANRGFGGAAKWWLHHSLEALDASLRALGSRLTVRRGPALATLEALIAETGADAVYWNRRYEPAITSRDGRIKDHLKRQGVLAESHNAALIFEPWDVRNTRGGISAEYGKPEAFAVFTPFWKAAMATLDGGQPDAPMSAPHALVAPPRWPISTSLAELGLLPNRNWTDGLARAWQPGEAAAQRRLEEFLEDAASNYSDRRDRPDLAATSRLSPHLRWGEISPRQIWHATHEVTNPGRGRGQNSGAEHFLREVGWREFAYHLLYHFPHTVTRPLQPSFEGFPYRDVAGDSAARADLRAWQRGQTGVPLVDAGMRELYTTGWMHNRTRMVVASQLTKDLLLDWRAGEAWFWDTLVDACPANNLLGWQWAAGVGADAAEYVRIFHPVLQGVKNDPAGDYIRRWVPELARLPAGVIHKPWTASPATLSAAGVELGRTYPRPIVDHETAKVRAEELYATRMVRRPASPPTGQLRNGRYGPPIRPVPPRR